jgi:hypothetical protein
VIADNAKMLGKFSGVDVVLMGTLTEFDSQMVLSVKGISTESSEIVAAGRIKFTATEELREMSGRASASSVGTSTSESRNLVEVGEAIPIVSRQLGDLEIHLMDIRGGKRDEIPQVSVSLRIQNKDLMNAQYLSLNGNLNEGVWVKYKTHGFRGGIIARNGDQWVGTPPELNGLPVIFAFDYTSDGPFSKTRQATPGSVGSYITGGIEYKNDGQPNRSGRYWSGGFLEVGPGESIDASVVFQPTTFKDFRPGWSRAPQVDWPTDFRMELELINGEGLSGGVDNVKRMRVDSLVFPKVNQVNVDGQP